MLDIALSGELEQASPVTRRRKPDLEIWGGVECTVARIADAYRDLAVESGHWDRPEDLDAIAALGIRTLRYPLLWEHVAPQRPDQTDWRWQDERLTRLRRLRIEPIAGLLHHGSGPRYTDLLDPQFPELLAAYAEQVARRYPDVMMYTPVNEPLTTARFSALYGLWYPHHKDAGSFLRALFNECYGTVLAMRRIRRVTPLAKLVQTEDLGKTFSTALLRRQAEYENERRWLSLDLLCGRVDRAHGWFSEFLRAGVPETRLRNIIDDPCPPDIIGINYYLSTDRFLDQHCHQYPQCSWGGNGIYSYADIEAVRIASSDLTVGVAHRLREAWERYRLPLAVTEVHNGCTREEQLRWLVEVYESVSALPREGIDLRAMTVWALIGSLDWHAMLTRRDGHYECGLFDIRCLDQPRPTLLAKATASLVKTGSFDHPTLDGPGWWHRDMRYYRAHNGAAQRTRPGGQRRLLITGATGTLGRAFARLCDLRGLAHDLTSRAELEIAEQASVQAALARYRPWAVINTAGYVRVPDAEREPERCFRENAEGAATLAAECARLGIPLVTYSSDLVFDGRLGRPYVEDDKTCPTCVYGASKAEAEGRVLLAHPASLVLRTSAFFGPWDPHNFVFHTLRALAAGDTWRASTDCTVSPTYVPDLVNSTLDLLVDGETGIWHLANRGAVSWGELARKVAERGGFDPSRVALDEPAGAPACTVLASSRGSVMPTLDSALDRFFSETEVNWAAEPAPPSR
ncbi:MAG: sugar nucleotide-binding protein [Alphaproteobacteria bacterium]|nr:sugar nucleotide-binding protein [Alphaproteobacteria bacterium]